jgi:hypothetical protein
VDAVEEPRPVRQPAAQFPAQPARAADIFIGAIRRRTASSTASGSARSTQGARSVAVARVGRDGKVRMGKTGKGMNTSGH